MLESCISVRYLYNHSAHQRVYSLFGALNVKLEITDFFGQSGMEWCLIPYVIATAFDHSQ